MYQEFIKKPVEILDIFLYNEYRMGKQEILCLSVLGGFEVSLYGKPLQSFESDKTRALLAYLAVEADHSHRREHLASLVWPEKPAAAARHSLSQALYSLRSLLNDPGVWTPFVISNQSIQMNRDHRVWLDTNEFSKLANSYDLHGHTNNWICEDCLEKLSQAVSLYRGSFLAGLSLENCQVFEEWATLQRELLQQKAVQSIERLAGAFTLRQDLERALSFAIRKSTLDPLDEAAHRQIMGLYDRLGRRSEALSQYAVCREILNAELSVEPEAETTALFHEIARQPGPTLVSAPAHNLPAPLTRLVGRQVELDQVCQNLLNPDCRLLTVLGPGGIGKTRLALEAGRMLLPAFQNGVFLAELSTQRADQTLIPVIAQAVGMEQYSAADALRRSQSTNLQEQLSGYLREKNLLLILDGFEGLLEQAPQAASLLRQAPGLKILVTSRARLNLKGERIINISGLSHPTNRESQEDFSGYGSVQLFIDAARRSKPEFNLTPQNRTAVSEICQLNQGMPLGILLAAAWIGTLSPVQITAEIKRSLDFLEVGWRDLPERQRSLRATFDHSWRLLSEPEQLAFLRLSIFQSAFSAKRAYQVADISIQTLKRLIDQSLLQQAAEDHYRMHDLLRQYAQEKLSALPETYQWIHERHCQVFMEALNTWEPRLKSRAQFDALAEMDQEQADIRAAWDWSVQQKKTDLLSNSAGGLSYYYLLRQQYELGAHTFGIAAVLASHDDLADQNLLAWAHLSNYHALISYYHTGNFEDWHKLEEIDRKLQAAASSERPLRQIRAETQLFMGQILVSRSQRNLLEGRLLPEAIKLLEHSLNEMRECGSQWDVAFGLDACASCHNFLGNIQRNQQLAEEGLSLAKEVGDPTLIVSFEVSLGYVYMLTGDYEKAMQIVKKQNEHRHSIGSRAAQGLANWMLGLAYYYAGQYEDARTLMKEACDLFSPTENMPAIRFACYIIYIMDLFTGDYQAVREGTAMARIQPADILPGWLATVKGQLWLVNGDFDQAEAELLSYLETTRSIHRMDMPGHALACLGYIAYRRGDQKVAYERLVQSLENGLQQGFFWGLILAFSVIAVILAENEELEQAIELYATATTHPMAANARLLEDLFGCRIAELTVALPPEILQAALRRGQGRDLYETGAAYLEKLRSGNKLLDALTAKI